jgi:hypothetical protein
LILVWTRASEVGSRRLMAVAMARPLSRLFIHHWRSLPSGPIKLQAHKFVVWAEQKTVPDWCFSRTTHETSSHFSVEGPVPNNSRCLQDYYTATTNHTISCLVVVA